MLNINDVINDVLKVSSLLGSSGSGHHVAMCRVEAGASRVCALFPLFCVCSQPLDESNKTVNLVSFEQSKADATNWVKAKLPCERGMVQFSNKWPVESPRSAEHSVPSRTLSPPRSHSLMSSQLARPNLALTRG